MNRMLSLMTRLSGLILLTAVLTLPVKWLTGADALFVRTALAQEDPVLPDLAPREVEITGDLTIAFPSLSRQPLVGFNPPPRVPEIAESRRPYTEPYKQPSAELPPSPITPPEPPDVSTIASRTPYRGVVSGGVGRYLERFLTADVSLVDNERLKVMVEGDYHGSDGTEPFDPVTSADSEFDRLGGSIALRRIFDSVTLATAAGGRLDRYSLFGAMPEPGSISLLDPDRTISDMNGRIGLRSADGSRNRFSVSFTGGASRVETDVFDPDDRIDPSTKRDETYLETDASTSLALGDMRLDVEAFGRTSGLDADGFPGSTLRYGRLAGAISWSPRPRLVVSAGASLFGFDTDAQTGSGREMQSTWIAPEGTLRFALSTSTDVYGRLGSAVGNAGLASVYASIPYLTDEPLLLPRLTSIDGRFGIRSAAKVITADVHAGLKDIPWYGYPEHPSAPLRNYEAGYPDLGYGEATVLYAGGSATVILSTAVQFGIEAEIREGELTGNDTVIPYFSPVVVGGHASAAFVGGTVQTQAHARYESPRYRDAAETRQIPGVFSLDVETSWFFTDRYALLAGVRHLGAEPEFWDLYPMPGSVIYTGLRLRW